MCFLVASAPKPGVGGLPKPVFEASWGPCKAPGGLFVCFWGHLRPQPRPKHLSPVRKPISPVGVGESSWGLGPPRSLGIGPLPDRLRLLQGQEQNCWGCPAQAAQGPRKQTNLINSVRGALQGFKTRPASWGLVLQPQEARTPWCPRYGRPGKRDQRRPSHRAWVP